MSHELQGSGYDPGAVGHERQGRAPKPRVCRACHATDLVSVLDLGKQPLANRFLSEVELEDTEPAFPLHLMRCRGCGLCQLSIVVPPLILYGRHYPYRSGYSEGWREHCRTLATELAGKSVLDIGCLDGVLLDECEKQGCAVMGCDPSGTSEHPLVPELFSGDTRIGHFDVIVAQNVFGHVDDARGFLEGVKANLKPDGVAIIECPWIVPLIRERRWDTIYHEHLSYWALYPLRQLTMDAGLSVHDVRQFPGLHGGTMRYYLSNLDRAHWERNKAVTYDVEVVRTKEWAFNGTAINYDRFRDSVHCEIQWWTQWFRENNQKVIAGYGASAKSSTFLNALPERPPLVGIFDDNLTKHNLYTPGRHYPVLKPTRMTLRDCEVLINFSPNWPLAQKARELGFTGEVKSTWNT